MSSNPPPPPTLENLFRRWRGEEDAEALAEVMARAEPELFAIARRQAPDDSAAWDLVQETWLTVLRAADRWDAEQRLMPWLVGILQIEARRARRATARTPDPRRLETPVEPGADAGAPAAEIRTLVADALALLPDRYRDVLSMHLFDDLSHAEIAARTGREPGTVRVQVFRGLAQLRKHLPASLALGAALATLAPRSEAARLAEVLDRVARPGAGGAGAGAAAAAGAGGAVAAWSASAAARWITVAAAALALAGGAWLVIGRGERGASDDRAQTALAESGRRDGAPELELGADRGSSRAVAQVPAGESTKPSAPGVWIVGRVAGLAGLPPAGPTLTLRPADARIPRRIVAVPAADSFEIDVGEWYAADGPAPREFIATYDHPHALPVRVPVLLDAELLAAARQARASGARREIPLSFDLVRPAARVHGRMAFGDDVEPALRGLERVAGLFELDERGEPTAEAVEGVPVRADGTFSLRAARPGRHRLVATVLGSGVRPTDVELSLSGGEDRDAGIVTLGAGSAIFGFVSLPAGFDPDSMGAVVRWRPRDPWLSRSVYGAPIAWIEGRFEVPDGEARAARDGAFRIAGLWTGEYELEAAFDLGGLPALAIGTAGDGGPDRVASVRAPARGVVLPSRGDLALLRVRGLGAPLPGVEISSATDRGPARAASDDRGRVLMHGDLAGYAPRLSLAKPGWRPIQIAIDATAMRPAGLDVDLEPALEPAALELVAAGVDWTGARAVLAPADSLGADGLAALRRGEVPRSTPGLLELAIDSGGQLARRVPPGRWWVLVRPPRDSTEGLLAHARPWLGEAELAPGAATRLDVDLRLAGRLRFEPLAAREGASAVEFELVAADGRTIELQLESLVQRGDARQGRAASTNRMPFGARATSALLDPGAYVLRVTIGPETSTRTVEVAAGRTTLIAW